MRLQSKNIEICHKTTLCRCLKYNNGTPGIGMEVARWIAEDVKAGVTGGDTWPVGAVCGAGTKCEVPPGCVFCVHAFLQTRHGIVNQENLKLTELAGKGIYEFTYLFTPVPIKGATGSTGSPIAMW
jgi:kynurenine formamidase